MQKLGWALACLILFFAGMTILSKNRTSRENVNIYTSWIDFIPKSGLFKVKLPSPPQYAKDFILQPGSSEKLRDDMYASEKIDGTLFLINVLTYPSMLDAKSMDDLLHHSLEELRHNKPDNHLLKFEKTKFKKSYPSLDFSLENKHLQTEGKIIINENRIFTITYTAQSKDLDSEEFHYFINSFDFTSKKAIP